MADRGTVVATVFTRNLAVLGSWTAVNQPSTAWTIPMGNPTLTKNPPTLGQIWPRTSKQ